MNLILWAKERLDALGWCRFDLDDAVLDAAVEAYQNWAGLPCHGHLDAVTVRSLALPRFCGVPDRIEEAGALARWNKKRLTWRVAGALPPLTAEQLRSAYREAWSYWSAVCGIEAVESVTPAATDVTHGTGAIDGAMGTLAWSELPNGSDRPLQQKYDTGEPWVVAESPGASQIDLVRVAAHEVGHALGLNHFAPGSGNLLDPTYSRTIRRPQRGDVEEAQKRYGPPLATPVPPPTPVPPGEPITIRVFGATRIEIPGYDVKPKGA